MNFQINATQVRLLGWTALVIVGIVYVWWSMASRQSLKEASVLLKHERDLAVTEAHDLQTQMEEIAIRLLRMEFTMRSLQERAHSVDRRTQNKVESIIEKASMSLSDDETLVRLVTSRQLFESAPQGTQGVFGAYTRMLDATNFIAAGIADYSERMAALETTVTKRIGFMDIMPTLAPVDGKVTSQFGVRFSPVEEDRRKKHLGVDIGGKIGTPIRAPADGIVQSAHRYGGYGNYISLNHGDVMTTRFAHLDDIRVKRGDKVVRGQIIGTLGNTGKSTGPHLHYEVRYMDRNIDPLLITNFGAPAEEQLAAH